MNPKEKTITDTIQIAIDALMELRTFLLIEGSSIEHAEKIVLEKVFPVKFDFEEIYRMYPRKLGKTNGIKKLRSTIRSQSQFEDLGRAVRNFISFHRRAGTGPEFIPYFSSFVSSWTDWTLSDTGTVKVGTPQTETTQEYLARVQKKKEEEAEEWAAPDPERVREILDHALGKKH